MKKSCTRCHVEKPLDQYFYDARSGRYRGYCKACETKAKGVREGYRFCFGCDRARPMDSFAIYRRGLKVYRRHECFECLRRRHNGYYLRDREQRLDSARKRYAAKPFRGWTPERRAQLNAANKRRRREDRETVLWHYGAECSCCGETELMFLTMDHVNDDGAEHRRQVPPDKLYRWIIKSGFPDSFRVLCYNCNCGRSRNGGECPHASEQHSSPA
jgi:hypothetical protein